MMIALAFLLTTQVPSGRQATEADYALLLKTLGIAALRPGANGMDPKAPNAANTDEAKANPYPNIPELLKFENGKLVKTKRDWDRRRREMIELLDREVYGRTPRRTPRVNWAVESAVESQMGDVPVITKKLVGRVDNRSYPAIEVNIRMTLVTPRSEKKVPVIMEFGFNFGPRPRAAGPVVTPPAPSPVPEWQSLLLKQGWGFAILDPTSYQADSGGGLTSGIIGLVNKRQPRKVDDWGALKAWAWGASRALDYLERDPHSDGKRVGIEGLSRYGKAAAVAMAYEPRFAVGFIGSSGQGGIKIWRRNSGEQVENVASSGEYHWMAGNYVRYAGPLTPGDLPVDGHQLLALCAPRPTFVGIGSPRVEGTWIDDRGTFMATSLASPAWEILGRKGLESAVMPPEGTPLIGGELAFSQHRGGHTNGPNWATFIRFASRYLDR